MVIHRYSSLKYHKRSVTTFCGQSFPMIPDRRTHLSMTKPNNCTSREKHLSCAKCIDILIGVYQKKINVLERLPVEEEPNAEPNSGRDETV